MPSFLIFNIYVFNISIYKEFLRFFKKEKLLWSRDIKLSYTRDKYNQVIMAKNNFLIQVISEQSILHSTIYRECNGIKINEVSWTKCLISYTGPLKIKSHYQNESQQIKN